MMIEQIKGITLTLLSILFFSIALYIFALNFIAVGGFMFSIIALIVCLHYLGYV